MFLNSLAAEAWSKRAVLTTRQSSESYFYSSDLRAGPEVLARVKPALNLEIAQAGVALNDRSGVVEIPCYLFICHLRLRPPPGFFRKPP